MANSLENTKREDVPWDELLFSRGTTQFNRCISQYTDKKNALHPQRDESTRDTTQIAFRPSLVSCNGQIPKDSSSLSPKWKVLVPLAAHTDRCLSEKDSSTLLHHRLFRMIGL